MSEHTGLPWEVSTCHMGEDCWCRVINGSSGKEDDSVVASGSVSAANADLIVTAVNSYHASQRQIKELREALERVEKRAAPHPDDTDEDRKRDLRHIAAIVSRALSNEREG